MTNEELKPYIGRIVKAVLKNGYYHIGELRFTPEQMRIWGIQPAIYSIGKVKFTANDVKYVFISIGGE